MNSFTKPLGEATVQDIQLELIRRTSFNAFDGERIAQSLLEHRRLWEAVIMDRLSFSNPGSLPASGLIKLRDVSDNLWNVDTLYILTPDANAAQELARVAESEQWGGEMQVHTKPRDVDAALGSGRETRALVSIWWD